LNLEAMLRYQVESPKVGLDLARVLLVHPDMPARLTLQTILRAGGYRVEVAASMPEAMAKLDEGEFELVLAHVDAGGRDVISYARVKDCRPATALITGTLAVHRSKNHVAIHTEDLPFLLGRVADLIGMRASRRYSRPVRMAG
jgi:DNA-binding NtrC family response regulator